MALMPARFRNSTTKYKVPVSGGADESAAVYSYVGTGQVYTNYSMNAIDGRAEYSVYLVNPIQVAVKRATDPAPVKRTYDNLFANNSVYSAEVLPRPQVSMSKIRHSADTWMAFDCAGTMAGVLGAGNNGYKAPGLKSTGIIWRHPNISANFVYFDGHAENLRTGDVDGGPLYDDVGLLAASATGVGAVGDERLLADH
jgi:prepilin-type processing-associated H-X9-DG protein